MPSYKLPEIPKRIAELRVRTSRASSSTLIDRRPSTAPTPSCSDDLRYSTPTCQGSSSKRKGMVFPQTFQMSDLLTVMSDEGIAAASQARLSNDAKPPPPPTPVIQPMRWPLLDTYNPEDPHEDKDIEYLSLGEPLSPYEVESMTLGEIKSSYPQIVISAGPLPQSAVSASHRDRMYRRKYGLDDIQALMNEIDIDLLIDQLTNDLS